MRGFVFAGISRSTATVFTFVGASRSDLSEAVAYLFSGRGAEASLPYSLGWARGSTGETQPRLLRTEKWRFSRQLYLVGALSEPPGDALMNSAPDLDLEGREPQLVSDRLMTTGEALHWWMMAKITPPLSFLLLGKREGGLEVSLRQMDELSPHHPSGTVAFCQRFTPVQWSSFSRFLETGEALDDYAKFRSSLMGTYASLTMSIASDNKALMGWHCGDELERLKSYNVATNVRSSMKVCMGSSSLVL
ncbi:hypothetical protein RHGRI_018632 [Rhododendron griersonianum]|uniref:Uncharacterized protein n=1 Tax=Rhododendron griersonianum TaxID=479676 RepID=A0AAV6K296_9ERIC|nr:hypothetical protein RHGRI_018632 [Rhododendron griersonianum]